MTALPTKRLTDRQVELLRDFELHFDASWAGTARASFPGERIDDWAEVKKVFTAIGGRWVKSTPKRPGYFELEPAALQKFRDALGTGEVFDPKLVDYFPTPHPLADQLVGLAGIEDLDSTDYVLEPSAGKGAIVGAIRRAHDTVRIHACEIVPEHQQALERYGNPAFSVVGADFLAWARTLRSCEYAAVVMNPPFGKDGGVEHVETAYDRCLRPGGILVSVMSAGVRFHADRKTNAFRIRLACADDGTVELRDNPDDAFKSSGTSVRTVTLVWRKPS